MRLIGYRFSLVVVERMAVSKLPSSLSLHPSSFLGSIGSDWQNVACDNQRLTILIGGTTNAGQLFPLDESSNNIVLQPSSEDGKTCFIAGKGKLKSAACSGEADQTFEIVEVLED